MRISHACGFSSLLSISTPQSLNWHKIVVSISHFLIMPAHHSTTKPKATPPQTHPPVISKQKTFHNTPNSFLPPFSQFQRPPKILSRNHKPFKKKDDNSDFDERLCHFLAIFFEIRNMCSHRYPHPPPRIRIGITYNGFAAVLTAHIPFLQRSSAYPGR